MRALILRAMAALLILAMPHLAQAQGEEQLPPELVELLKSLAPVSGSVPISQAEATLDLGEQYQFYGPEDAKTILESIWGNPPGTAEGVLGVVMPAGTSPASESWGAVVTFEDVGYVTDDDAKEVDYNELLTMLKEDADASNEERVKAGYPAVHVIDWAEAPFYNSSNHSVIWARELMFDGDTENALNYDLRLLGRRGVLSINFLSGMSNLEEIGDAANKFALHAQFDAGARYADYDSSVDKAAGYGIGGLVAAGVGLAAAKKFGLLVLLAKFWKFILIGFVALAALVRKVLGMRKSAEEEWQEEEADPRARARAQAGLGEGEAFDPWAEKPQPDDRGDGGTRRRFL